MAESRKEWPQGHGSPRPLVLACPSLGGANSWRTVANPATGEALLLPPLWRGLFLRVCSETWSTPRLQATLTSNPPSQPGGDQPRTFSPSCTFKRSPSSANSSCPMCLSGAPHCIVTATALGRNLAPPLQARPSPPHSSNPNPRSAFLCLKIVQGLPPAHCLRVKPELLRG